MAEAHEVYLQDVVWYHGSIKDAHGMYRVADMNWGAGDGRIRFELRPLDQDNTRFLYNARAKSFTVLKESHGG